MIEKDYNCYTEGQRAVLKQNIFEETKSHEYLNLDYHRVGYPKPGTDSNYASCIRIVDPLNLETVYLEEFENGETVFSLYISQTVGLPGQAYLFLGIGQEATLQRKCKMAYINTYTFSQDGTSI